MKLIAYSLLLAALMAGCSGNPSKEVAIEDRNATETKMIVDPSLVETTGKPAEETVTTGSATQPLANKSTEAVQTSGLVAPSSDVKGLGNVKDQGNGKVVTGANASAGAGAGAGVTKDGAILPYSGSANQADLKDPGSLLSRRRVMFDFNSDTIRDEFRVLLEAHAQYLKSNSSARVILQGNTDERGSREYNLALGQRRAESVLKALNLLGVPNDKMEAVSMGEEKPIAEGHDEAAWQQNRRTEILYQGE